MTELRPLDDTGLVTPPLVLGGNVFGWTVSGEEAFRILDRFAAAGGTMVDTADVYSAWIPGNKGGESENLIGEWIRRGGGKLAIATKVGFGDGLSAKAIEAGCDASLKRLGVERIDLYYAHKDDPETPLEETLATFDRLVRAGKVGALGASNYSAARLAEALAISAREGLAAYRVVQPEYNLLTRGAFEGPLQQLCIAEGLGVLPYFGLAAGFLTGKYRTEADFAKSARGNRVDSYLNDRGRAVLAALDAVAAETHATPGQVALAWLAAQPGVTAPIASARTLDQLEELFGMMSLELTPAQRDMLDAL
jgi:aryl-alcohol dehydrogenase-like predicted oxidoreductase